MSNALRSLRRGIAYAHTSHYHPSRNSSLRRYYAKQEKKESKLQTIVNFFRGERKDSKEQQGLSFRRGHKQQA